MHINLSKVRNVPTTNTFLAFGKIISNDDLTLYILGGIGSKYDFVVVNMTLRSAILPTKPRIAFMEVKYWYFYWYDNVCKLCGQESSIEKFFVT